MNFTFVRNPQIFPTEVKGSDVIPMYDKLIEQLRSRASWIEFAIVAKPSKTDGNGDAILFRKAADAIDELSHIQIAPEKIIQTMWIPVTERLPMGADKSGKVCENVILLLSVPFSENYVTSGWINGITEKVYYVDEFDDFFHKTDMSAVKAWMPFPQPPKDGES